ncbi:Pex24p-domain-containing protein [Hanseniaspora valbyensis NRRL Y-1626]|uniref:Pex24p-domain-containing protein n=1 Tax=Hanseniaspora valbyensis NRRL Y-1626 TaxID=766949 RepID=A0A1B7TD22_9ASCO|nr:Pex24p-domain-containing protein [Hanseniaspora valbyensis NRRL Y-1626]
MASIDNSTTGSNGITDQPVSNRRSSSSSNHKYNNSFDVLIDSAAATDGNSANSNYNNNNVKLNDILDDIDPVETHSQKELDETTTTKTTSNLNNSDTNNSHQNVNNLNNIKRATLINPDSVKLDERLGFNHRNKKIKDKPIRGVLKNKPSNNNSSNGAGGNHPGGGDDGDIIVSSPLLTSTPNSISRALIRLYPYLIVFDKILSLLTWTSDDIWSSVLMVLAYISICLYYKLVVTYLGHLLCVFLLFVYSQLDKFVGEQMEAYPTLDDIVYTVSSVSSKFDLLFSPITVLNNNDLKRLLITTVFLSPLYIVITIFFLPKEKLVLTLGVIALSYHSRYSKLARHILWRFKLVRLISFYITGLDIDGIKGIKRASSYYASSSSLFATVHKKLLKSRKAGVDSESELMNDMLKNNKPIRFTYVLYENQRRWLGKGWTNTLFAYERAAWTDEFYNEAPDPESFKLPITANDDDHISHETGNGGKGDTHVTHSSMIWRWVDKGWRLDLSNDNTIELPSTMSKTIANPKPEEGWVYYDNTWKKPSVEDTYSKYTRRRRWIRTAELVRLVPESTKIEALKIKKGTISSPDISNVTVQVESKFKPNDNIDGENVKANTSGLSLDPIDSNSRENSVLNSDSDFDSDNNTNIKNRKVSFLGTAQVRTFDENDTIRSQKKNSLSNNVKEDGEEEEDEVDDGSRNNSSTIYDSDRLL